MENNKNQKPAEDKKSMAQKNNSGKENKAKETKPHLQEDMPFPVRKGQKAMDTIVQNSFYRKETLC